MIYPHRDGFVDTFQSLTLAEGSSLFTGLRGWQVNATIDGESIVFVEGRKAGGRTPGRIKVEGTLTLILDSALDYAVEHGAILDQIHTVTGTLDRPGRPSVKQTLTQLRLLEFPFDLKGTEEVEVALKFSAFDFLINGVSLVGGDDLGLNIAVA